MGAEPYSYFTKYDPDIQRALDTLRQTEFEAGRYEPCFAEKTGKFLFDFGFGPRHAAPAPGACHDTIETVYENLGADGSKSILDIMHAVGTPFPKVEDPFMSPDIMERLHSAAPLAEDDLVQMFGTAKPTTEQIESIVLATGAGDDVDTEVLRKRDMFWMQLDRGQSRYIITYSDGEPDQIFFAGLSFD